MSPLDQLVSPLGFKSYNDYLNSPHWKEFRRRYSLSSRPQSCLVCHSVQIELHHVHYTRVGHESLNDVMPLCRSHHNELHTWLKEHRFPISASPIALQFIKSSIHLLYCKPCNRFQMLKLRSRCPSCSNQHLIRCWNDDLEWNPEAPHHSYIKQLQPKEF